MNNWKGIHACLLSRETIALFILQKRFCPQEYSQVIRTNDRATMLNLMVGLNGYTLCSGIICEELNGSDYLAVPFRDDAQNPNSTMEIGYVVRKNTILSRWESYILNKLKRYLI